MAIKVKVKYRKDKAGNVFSVMGMPVIPENKIMNSCIEKGTVTNVSFRNNTADIRLIDSGLEFEKVPLWIHTDRFRAKCVFGKFDKIIHPFYNAAAFFLKDDPDGFFDVLVLVYNEKNTFSDDVIKEPLGIVGFCNVKSIFKTLSCIVKFNSDTYNRNTVYDLTEEDIYKYVVEEEENKYIAYYADELYSGVKNPRPFIGGGSDLSAEIIRHGIEAAEGEKCWEDGNEITDCWQYEYPEYEDEHNYRKIGISQNENFPANFSQKRSRTDFPEIYIIDEGSQSVDGAFSGSSYFISIHSFRYVGHDSSGCSRKYVFKYENGNILTTIRINWKAECHFRYYEYRHGYVTIDVKDEVTEDGHVTFFKDDYMVGEHNVNGLFDIRTYHRGDPEGIKRNWKSFEEMGTTILHFQLKEYFAYRNIFCCVLIPYFISKGHGSFYWDESRLESILWASHEESIKNENGMKYGTFMHNFRSIIEDWALKAVPVLKNKQIKEKIVFGFDLGFLTYDPYVEKYDVAPNRIPPYRNNFIKEVPEWALS